MATQIKITQLTDIGSANLSVTTLLPVVNMAGVPTTQKTTLGNLANVILSQSGGNYAAVGTANIAYSVANAAQPNITSVGTLTNVVVSGNATVNGNITSNGTAYVGNLSTTGLASITTLSVGATANLGAVGNITITGGTAGQVLSTNGNGVLSWASDATSYGNSNVVTLLSAFGSNTITTTGNITGGNMNISNGYANVTGNANVVGGGATVGVRSILAIDSAFGSNDANDPASAQAVRGRVTGNNLTKTRNYVAGVTGQYLVTGTNASEFINTGLLGVVGDQTTTANAAVVAYLDGDGGLTTAGSAYGVSMKNSTPGSGFDYGLDLQFIDLNVAGTTTPFKQADIRFNNGVELVANTANNISINADVTVGNITATNLGNIATANLDGSNSNVLYGNGVFAAVAGGANTGNVTFDDNIVIGTGDEFGSAGLFLAPGNGSIANSAVQYLRVRGGDAPTHIHLDTGNNQFYDQYFGDDAKYVKLELGDAGNVVIGTDDANGNQYNWSFTSDGNLILAGGDSVIQSIANSSLEPNYPNTSTMVFTPDALYSSQSLVLDPTGPSHIHLRAPGANIDEPDANIFLGGEDSSFEVGYYNGAAPNVFVHSGGNTWTFDTAGNLVLPQGSIITNNIPPVTFDILFQYDDLVWAGNTLTFTNASSTYMLGVLALMEVGDTIILGSTSTTVTGVYTGGGAGTFTVSGTGGGQQIAQFTLPNRLTSVNGIKLTTNAKNYLFTEAGVTQSPVLTVDTLPSGQYAVAGFRAFVSDANLASVGNFGAIVGNSGSNIVCVWCDGTNWRIG
jgi:hypothetical protein